MIQQITHFYLFNLGIMKALPLRATLNYIPQEVFDVTFLRIVHVMTLYHRFQHALVDSLINYHSNGKY